jgi:hypothetical protein
MANPVIRIWNDAGTEVLFDSWADDVLFFVEERPVESPNYTNRQVVYSYPQLAGRKIVAFMTAPYNYGSRRAWALPSCRVSYSGNVPVVTVFLDDQRTDLPIAAGMLTIMLSGVTQ